MDAVHLIQGLKRRVLGGYVKTLERIDPKLATHVLSAQREFFMAGKVFFEEEVRHADKALRRIRKADEAGKDDRA